MTDQPTPPPDDTYLPEHPDALRDGLYRGFWKHMRGER